MKNRNTLFTITRLALCFLALGCLVFPQRTHAVSPAPDGGYPRFNTAEGQNALFSLTTGQWNTALGAFTLWSDTEGSNNTAVGTAALLSNVGSQNGVNGSQNTAVGAAALLLNTTGSNNTGVGTDALVNNTSGYENTAAGDSALLANTHGDVNTALGGEALAANNGDRNTAVGKSALFNNTTGSGNIALGFNAGSGVTTANNVICIGADGNNVDNACYIGEIFGATSSGGTAVFINSNGRLGTATSSQRFKDDIKPMDKASEALFALKPVTFRYKKEVDPQRIPQFGLVAEEVEKVNPDLVVRDKDGKPYSVRYDQVNAMLLNEFLKEHRKVEEQEAGMRQLKSTVSKQEAIIAQQQQGMEALTARLNEQAAQIQKVSTRIDLDRSAPQQVAARAP